MKHHGILLMLAIITIALLRVQLSQVSAQPTSFLEILPELGPVGTEINIVGHDFPPNSAFELYWEGFEGSWIVDGHDFLGSAFSLKEYLIATVTSNASGSFNLRIKVPYDYGGRHYITAIEEISKANMGQAVFTVIPSFQISTTSGPPGTPITIQGSGLGNRMYTTNWHVLWDNKYVGYATAITTQGNATFTIYATGDVGTHYIDIYEGYPGPAYLNIHEAPPKPEYYFPPYVPFHAEFNVTPPDWDTTTNAIGLISLGGLGLITVAMIAASVSHGSGPAGRTRRLWALISMAVISTLLSGAVLAYTSTTSPLAGLKPQSSEISPTIILPDGGVDSPSNESIPTLTVEPQVAKVGENVTISGAGFPSNIELELTWLSKEGSYLVGWTDLVRSLKTVTTDTQGSFATEIKVLHDLEGIHEITASSESVQAVQNATLYIIRSAFLNQTKGPSGTVVEVKMTGVGWTFVTNTATIVYDNSFVGYACGFFTLGNVTLYVDAVGRPGIHTIDIYPTIYDGPPQGTSSSIYRYPLLTPEDHPARTAAFHFEFLITESDHGQTSINFLFTPMGVSLIALVASVAFLAIQARRLR